MLQEEHKPAGRFSKLWVILFIFSTIAASFSLFDLWKMKHLNFAAVAFGLAAGVHGQSSSQCSSSAQPNLSWYAPNQTMINNLTTVVNGTGVYGYIFNSSRTPSSVPYSTYNWCNMPHARKQEYVVPDNDFKLQYVEVVRLPTQFSQSRTVISFFRNQLTYLQIHRHHKRTPYQSNTFPIEAYPWLCNDSSLYYFGAPQPENNAAQLAWSIYQSPTNPFKPTGFPNQTCQFPQITGEGLYDSRQHGADLFSVYHDTLHFLPDTFNSSQISFRVTNNVITSQVAGEVLIGMYSSLNQKPVPALVQPTGVDSLEPQYTCSAAVASYSAYGVGSKNPTWQTHLNQSTALFAQLDTISGVNSSDSGWHNWFDHYFDNLSAKLCHNKPLPCNITNSSLCVSQDTANAVFRRGLYEYSYIYRDNNASLAAATGSFGVWMAELASHLRGAMNGAGSGPIYRHNIAHDGSMSRLLSILQIDVMVWPGMGSEIVFELWRRQSSECYFLRVLWKGQVLRSSNPSLGSMDMVPVDVFLGYVDGLVGVDASKVVALCSGK